MSIKADPNDLEMSFIDVMSSHSVAMEGRSSPKAIPETVYQMAEHSAKNLGLLNIVKGDYKVAQRYFREAVEHQYKWRAIEEPFNNPNFYYPLLSCISTAILINDKKLLEDWVSKIDFSVSVEDWPRGARPGYCLLQVISGLVLNWDKEKMNRLRELSKDMRKDMQTLFNVVWAIYDNDLENLIESFKSLIKSEIHRHNHSVVQQFISATATSYLIIARMKGMDLEDFDPPLVDMNYIRLIDSK